MLKQSIAVLLTASTLAACVDAGASYRADVFSSSGVNSQQELKVIQIQAVSPGKVEVDNSENQKTAQAVGAIFGALAGAYGSRNSYYSGSATIGGAAAGSGIAGVAVKDKVLVDGVQIVYVHEGRALQSAQVGKRCEFALGAAYLVTTDGSKETRIQPNASTKCVKGQEDQLAANSKVFVSDDAFFAVTHTDSINSIKREQELESARNDLDRTKLSGDRVYTERKREAVRADTAERKVEKELETHDAVNKAIINRSERDTTVIVK